MGDQSSDLPQPTQAEIQGGLPDPTGEGLLGRLEAARAKGGEEVPELEHAATVRYDGIASRAILLRSKLKRELPVTQSVSSSEKEGRSVWAGDILVDEGWYADEKSATFQGPDGRVMDVSVTDEGNTYVPVYPDEEARLRELRLPESHPRVGTYDTLTLSDPDNPEVITTIRQGGVDGIAINLWPNGTEGRRTPLISVRPDRDGKLKIKRVGDKEDDLSGDPFDSASKALDFMKTATLKSTEAGPQVPPVPSVPPTQPAPAV